MDYQGDFQYENGVLQFIAQPEGYIYKDAMGYRYVYQYKDHLGNNRLSFMRNAGTVAIVKETNYYPFGLTHKGYNNLTTSLGSAGAKKYLYNGKELQDGFGLDWYDYGARFYDASLGRWFVVDPMASEKSWVSPYNYCQNNPILRIDPDGRFDNPIYDTKGNFLGTDDKGLQGDAIVMDKSHFKQGMKHNEAAVYNLGTDNLTKEQKDKMEQHFSSLPGRPDWDGKVTVIEALLWYNTGGGKPLYVDISKMNFKSSNLTVSDFKGKSTLRVNFFPLNTNKEALHRP
ncbi:RHS repeat-associated core domain-containing protein [Candidatus Sulfidibacterium hydrothermale]|uniref:RHS repeat domain-containing protein n=1 Tax=Candidatus Sulfidibacterium hydrothermale TaxID=2875962 RepID=UPI001F0B2A3D|nr:RHS repeat-associated core domain-containing protein [Candidatus Sulfidibacterium hydrothermale]UBM61536.1 RHS repeat-associated core domain-containing protein [Candidatus Sulfidibacterium hydrothermale]